MESCINNLLPKSVTNKQIRTVARGPQPTTDEELESVKAEIDDLRKAVRDALPGDLREGRGVVVRVLVGWRSRSQ